MKIQSMFQKDIDRDINGVIKVSQDDQQSLKQELSEYIITKELRRHFATFFDNYSKAIDTPTDKIGVWISGFFGSGKSHFLKMLSYLLSNKEVDGKHAFAAEGMSISESTRRNLDRIASGQTSSQQVLTELRAKYEKRE